MTGRSHSDGRSGDCQRGNDKAVGESFAGGRAGGDGAGYYQPAAQYVPAQFKADQQLLRRGKVWERNILPSDLQHERKKEMGVSAGI